jgi:cob(I)alamin adenosyltransferase
MKGYVQLYTGDGKGKTTAAIGQAIRAAGAGLRVFIGQFVKGMHYSELDSLQRFSDCITIKQFGRDCFIHNNPTDDDCCKARDGLEEIKSVLQSGEYQMVILDEVNIATYYKLFSVEDLLEVIHSKPENIELILTGRQADTRIAEAADLITEMKEIKHYYQQGVQARAGIEK